jgi:hypothetical protein
MRVKWLEWRYWYVQRPLEKARLKFVWCLPRWLVYWCSIRLIAYATQGEYANTIVPDLTAMDALKRWEKA